MGDFAKKKIDLEGLIRYSDDLVQVLKNGKDVNDLKLCFQHSEALLSQCDSDFSHVQTSLQDYQRKIDMCMQKTEAAKSEAAADAEIELLQRELEEELQRESVLREELRVITNEINDLECQRISMEERRQTLKKIEQDEHRAQMKLSMYASVTNIIPSLDDDSKISGCIVKRDKKLVEKFELDPVNVTAFDACNSIWEMIKM